MRKTWKKAVSLVLVFAMSMMVCAPAFAVNRNSNKLTKSPLFKQSETKSSETTNNGKIVITDKKKIAKIAKQQKLNDPESITKITYDFRGFSQSQIAQQIEDNTNLNLLPKAVKKTTKIYNVKDLGSGFSYWDQYDSSIYDGPAHVKKTYTRTASSTYDADVSVDYKLIEAAVGFTFTSGQKVEEAYSFYVPANHSIELRVFTNYQKKSYDIGTGLGGLLYYKGSGTAQKPVGLIFQQIQR
jgi:hypothetical protein